MVRAGWFRYWGCCVGGGWTVGRASSQGTEHSLVREMPSSAQEHPPGVAGGWERARRLVTLQTCSGLSLSEEETEGLPAYCSELGPHPTPGQYRASLLRVTPSGTSPAFQKELPVPLMEPRTWTSLDGAPRADPALQTLTRGSRRGGCEGPAHCCHRVLLGHHTHHTYTPHTSHTPHTHHTQRPLTF